MRCVCIAVRRRCGADSMELSGKDDLLVGSEVKQGAHASVCVSGNLEREGNGLAR